MLRIVIVYLLEIVIIMQNWREKLVFVIWRPVEVSCVSRLSCWSFVDRGVLPDDCFIEFIRALLVLNISHDIEVLLAVFL